MNAIPSVFAWSLWTLGATVVVGGVVAFFAFRGANRAVPLSRSAQIMDYTNAFGFTAMAIGLTLIAATRLYSARLTDAGRLPSEPSLTSWTLIALISMVFVGGNTAIFAFREAGKEFASERRFGYVMATAFTLAAMLVVALLYNAWWQ